MRTPPQRRHVLREDEVNSPPPPLVSHIPSYPFPPLALSALLAIRITDAERRGRERLPPACSFPAIYAMRPGINFSKINRLHELSVPAGSSASRCVNKDHDHEFTTTYSCNFNQVLSLQIFGLTLSGNSCCKVLYYNGFIVPGRGRQCMRVHRRDGAAPGVGTVSGASQGGIGAAEAYMEIITPTSYAQGRSRSLPLSFPHPLSDPMRFLTRIPPLRWLCRVPLFLPSLLVLNPSIMRRARAIKSSAPRGLIADDSELRVAS